MIEQKVLIFVVISLLSYLGYGALPSWKPSYLMSQSTIFMPCNYSGFFDPKFAAQFTIADFDWSNGRYDWANQKPMDCEERLIKQANMVKAVNPDAKVWVYRNLVKALPWFSTVREKITDPAYSGWFLRFKSNGPYHVPQCTGNLCSDLYHDQDQTPQHPDICVDPCDCGSIPCGEYLFDHRNESLRNFLVQEFILGPNGLGNLNVSGFYLDDGWTDYPAPIQPWQPSIGFCDHSPIGGPTEEDFYCTVDMGLTQTDTTTITNAYKMTMDLVHEAINAHGGFSWDQFNQISAPDKSQCANFFQAACASGNPKYDKVALMQTFNWSSSTLKSLNEDLATFLLIRGDYAWLGYGWSGCTEGAALPGGGGGNNYVYPSAFNQDYGVPSGQCTESSSGVFKREWTKASVTMDCNTWTGSIVMK